MVLPSYLRPPSPSDIIRQMRPPSPLAMLHRPATRAARAVQQDLSPEEEQSILSRAGSIGLGGLARVGNLLDIPGSIVRSFIVGEPTLHQLLPWHWTTDVGRVSPGEMLERTGILSPQFRKESPWLSFGAEMAAGLVTDPLTYLGLPGVRKLTAAGEAMKRMNLLKGIERALPRGMGPRLGMMKTTPAQLLRAHRAIDPAQAQALQQTFGEVASKMGRTTAELLDQPLARRNLMPAAIGETWSQVLDNTFGAIGRSAPGRTVNALFRAQYGGARDYWGQLVQREKSLRIPEGRIGVNVELQDLADSRVALSKAFTQAFGDDTATWAAAQMGTATDRTVDQVVSDIVRWTGEGKGDLQGALRRYINPAAHGRLNATQQTEIQSLVTRMKLAQDTLRDTGVAMGRRIGKIDKYFPRQADLPYIRTLKWQEARGAPRVLPTREASRHRQIAEIQASIVDDMLVDPQIRAAKNLKDRATVIRQRYGEYLDLGYKVKDKTVGPEGHARALARYIIKHPQQRMFTRDVMDDAADHMYRHMVANKSTEAIHELFRRNIAPGSARAKGIMAKGRRVQFRPGQEPGTQYVSLKAAYDAAGLDSDRALNHLSRLIKATEGVQPTPDQLAKWAVPMDLANAAKATVKFVDQPEWQNMILDFVDTTTRWFKQGVTAHPANWIRNLYSGQIANAALSGDIQTPSDLALYSKLWWQSAKRTGDPNLVRDALTYRVIEPMFGGEGVNLGQRGMAAAGMGARQLQYPWQFRETGRQALAAARRDDPAGRIAAFLGIDSSMAPGAALGAAATAHRGIATGWGAVMTTSAKANQLVEFQNRVPMWLYLQKKGWTPQAAAERTMQLQLDYRFGLAPFEKKWMRRTIPFYSFSRLMAANVGETLLRKPRGVMGTALITGAQRRDDTALTPDYVSRGLSIPLAPTAEGDRRYFTATGMPWEDPLSIIGGPRHLMQNLMARATPLAKGPTEWGTGVSFFQPGLAGMRGLEDMDPTIGRLMRNIEQLATGARTKRPPPVKTPALMESVFANLPISRYLTSARVITDPRKHPLEKMVNLLTGARLTHISEAAQDVVLRERVEHMARAIGARQFARTYIPDEVLERLPPAQREQAEEVKAMMAVLARRAKQRAEAAGR